MNAVSLDLFNPAHTSPQADPAPVDVTPASSARHFNTTSLAGDELQAAKRRNGQQNAVILAVFRRSETPLGPWEVMHRCHAAGHPFLIGSVRRAITTLTEDGQLVKLATKRRGDAGATEHQWGIA